MSNVIVIGLPGCGKSTVGRALAAATGRDFLDLDEEFTSHTGTSPANYLRLHGEEAFRRIEAELALRAAQARSTVIATGGGTVIDPISRWVLWHCGTVIRLDAPDEVLAERIACDQADRPLSSSVSEIAALRERREPYYAGADHTIDTRASLQAITTEAAAFLARARRGAARTLYRARVRRDHLMGLRQSEIVFGSQLAPELVTEVIGSASRGTCLAVADSVFSTIPFSLMAAFQGVHTLSVDGGEEAKRFHTLEGLLTRASDFRLERADAWVAIGGGTIGDLVGTAAALYMRGAPLVQIPTTWLAMSDAALGGKVAVDLETAKNAVGAFWPPVAVISDVSALGTLPWEHRLNGMAECLKSGLIGDRVLWELVKERGAAALAQDADDAARYAIIERSARLKLGVVDRDPFEAGERRNLNLGHTIGHALEIESRYALPHGRAVALGIRAVAHIAAGRGLLGEEEECEINEVMTALGFETHRLFDTTSVMSALTGDKKSEGGRIRWILPAGIGEVTQVNDVTEHEVAAALDHIREA